jgi:hypothetical protein
MPPKEQDLYRPVKGMLEREGYVVKSEVNDCDIVAMKDQQVLVVELKLRFNLDLVLQGIERQRMTDHVYLAIPAPSWRSRNWYSIMRLCRRLNLGLITVNLNRHPVECQVVLPVGAHQPRADKRGLKKMINEFNNRSGDYNQGGVTGQKIITAYRENALKIAWYIDSVQDKRCALKEIRQDLGLEKASRILQNNVYGWFCRTDRGVYSLTSSGEKALQEYKEVIDRINHCLH